MREEKKSLAILYGTACRSLHRNVGSLDGQSFYAGKSGEDELAKDVKKVEEARQVLESLIDPSSTGDFDPLEKGTKVTITAEQLVAMLLYDWESGAQNCPGYGNAGDMFAARGDLRKQFEEDLKKRGGRW